MVLVDPAGAISFFFCYADGRTRRKKGSTVVLYIAANDHTLLLVARIIRYQIYDTDVIHSNPNARARFGLEHDVPSQKLL